MLEIIVTVLIGLLVFAYLGYPLLLYGLAKLFARPINHTVDLPTISLIIAAFNEEIIIRDKLENSLALDYPRELLELIVVTDGSSDGTGSIVNDYEKDGVVLMHSAERRGKSAAINRAAQQAHHDILLFSDANAFYLPDALRKLVRNFGDAEVGAVSGSKTVRKTSSSIAGSEGAYWKYESFLKKQESKIASTTGVVGEMIAIRRALYTPIPAHIINDDAYLAFKLMQDNWRVIYEPEAICWEDSAESSRAETIRRQRITAGRFQLMFAPNLWPWRNPTMLAFYWGHKFLRLLLGFIMVAAFVLNLVILTQPNPSVLLQLTAVGQLAFYALAGWGYLLERQQKKQKLPAIAYYITAGNLATISGFWRFLSGKQTVLWQTAQRKPLTPSTPAHQSEHSG